MIYIADALAKLAPKAKFAVVDNDINRIDWQSEDIEQPSNEAIQAKLTELKNAEPMRVLREKRNQKLAETDWWCASDRTPTQEQLNYRTALRDLPSTASPSFDENENLTGVDWPEMPA
jgi:hypothetical protein